MTTSQKYKLICKSLKTPLKNSHYIDFTMLSILKDLYKNHKINRYTYKNAIYRVNNGLRVKNSLQQQITLYLHTIKSRSSQNTLIAIDCKKRPSYKRFMPIEYNNLDYAVRIRKHCYNDLTKSVLNSDYKNILVSKIGGEFQRLMTENQQQTQ